MNSYAMRRKKAVLNRLTALGVKFRQTVDHPLLSHLYRDVAAVSLEAISFGRAF